MSNTQGRAKSVNKCTTFCLAGQDGIHGLQSLQRIDGLQGLRGLQGVENAQASKVNSAHKNHLAGHVRRVKLRRAGGWNTWLVDEDRVRSQSAAGMLLHVLDQLHHPMKENNKNRPILRSHRY